MIFEKEEDTAISVVCVVPSFEEAQRFLRPQHCGLCVYTSQVAGRELGSVLNFQIIG